MSEELKACPFCGSRLELNSRIQRIEHPEHALCPISNYGFANGRLDCVDAWNTRPSPPPSAWRDIGEAPRDGSSILTWGCLHDDGGVDMGETPRRRISWWLDDGWYSPCSGSHEPTHFQPLPPPPNRREGEPTG